MLKQLAIIFFSLVFIVLVSDIIARAEQEQVLIVDEVIQLFQ
ncbi:MULTISPECIES: hypothetical protein [unclassified Bacillus (in: firmicutes)]